VKLSSVGFDTPLSGSFHGSSEPSAYHLIVHWKLTCNTCKVFLREASGRPPAVIHHCCIC